jgi:hypothetical protein
MFLLTTRFAFRSSRCVGNARGLASAATPRLYRLEENATGIANVADCDISKGTVVYQFEEKAILPESNEYSLQLDASTHMEVQGDCKYTPHSCDPNCYLRFTKHKHDKWEIELVAIKNIKIDEWISFNYNIAEHVMSHPFDCACGAPKCTLRIQGYQHLSPSAQMELAPFVSPFIASLQASNE